MDWETHAKAVLHKLSEMLHARVVLSIVGMHLMTGHPAIAQWIVAIIGIAVGSTAVDTFKGPPPGGPGPRGP